MAEEPRVFAWVRSYQLLTRFPTLPQPGFTDPQLHEALAVIAVEMDAVDLERLEADKTRAGKG